MINNVTFTGVQKQIQQFMSDAAHEYMSTGKVFSPAERAVAEEISAQAAKSSEAVEVPFFNHRGDVNNNPTANVVAKLQDLEAAKSYARSHGVHIAEEAAEAVEAGLKANA
ncbi:hypothetical protein IJ472_00435 [bacterium]|nr:hypothetical protein [bacterium]